MAKYVIALGHRVGQKAQESFSSLWSNQSFVEERNRVQFDSISDYLFAPPKLAELLNHQKNDPARVFITGNLIVDL